jgi:hypothetical protein
VERAVLHDHAEGTAVLQDLDVRKRIPVDQQEVGKRALRHHAKLAGPSHELAPETRGRHQRLHGGKAKDLDEEPEVSRIGPVRSVDEAVVPSR